MIIDFSSAGYSTLSFDCGIYFNILENLGLLKGLDIDLRGIRDRILLHPLFDSLKVDEKEGIVFTLDKMRTNHLNSWIFFGQTKKVKQTMEEGIIPDQTSANLAAQWGFIDILELIFNKTRILPNMIGSMLAVKFNRVDVLDFIWQKSSCLPINSAIKNAIYLNKPDVLKFVWSKRKWTEEELDLAASLNRLDILKLITE